MKSKFMKFLGCALALCLLLSGCGGKKYATVNGEEITMDEYNTQMDLLKNMLAARAQLSNTVSQQLIQQAVIKQDLKKNNVKVTEEEKNVDYEELIKNYGGAQQYQQALQFLGVTDEQMRSLLVHDTEARLHKKMFNEKNEPAQADLEKYFNDNKDKLIQVDCSHILVASEEEAKKVKERLAAGEKFEDLAKELSKDSTGKDGGALGSKSPSTFVPEFGEALLKLAEGQISDPVKTQFGWHIIKVNKKLDSLDKVKDQVVSAVNEEKYKEYLDNLIKSADVKIAGQEESSKAQESSTGAQESSAAK